MRIVRELLVYSLLLGGSLSACGISEPEPMVSETQQALTPPTCSSSWSQGQGRGFYVCGGAIHVREWPSDGAQSRGLAPNLTAVHSYSDRDSDDGYLDWEPAYIYSPTNTHGWVKRSHLCPCPK